MRKLLIADTSDSFPAALSNVLKNDFQVFSCSDGLTAYRELRSQKPDAAVIHLRLPDMDGLTILQKLYPDLPQATLILTPYISSYVERILSELGVNYVLITPIPPEIVADHLTNMLDPSDCRRRMVKNHLKALSIPQKSSGYRHLTVGIPLYAKDRQQRLSKELYPAIAEICGTDSGTLVEHSIRTAIASGWSSGDRDIWLRYFPDCTSRQPTNKELISVLSEMI